MKWIFEIPNTGLIVNNDSNGYLDALGYYLVQNENSEFYLLNTKKVFQKEQIDIIKFNLRI